MAPPPARPLGHRPNDLRAHIARKCLIHTSQSESRWRNSPSASEKQPATLSPPYFCWKTRVALVGLGVRDIGRCAYSPRIPRRCSLAMKTNREPKYEEQLPQSNTPRRRSPTKPQKLPF